MTGRERMKVTMLRGVPDRVPLMCQLSIGHYLIQTGLDPVELWCDSEVLAEAMVSLQRQYGFDGILVNLPGRDPDWRRQVRRLRSSGTETVIEWRDGSATRFPADDNPAWMRPDDEAPPRFDELEPDLLHYVEPWGLSGPRERFCWDFGAFPDSEEDCFPPWQNRALEAVSRLAGSGVSLHAELFSPWSQFLELLGCQSGLMAILDDPERACACIERMTVGAAQLAASYARFERVDAILISSAYAGASFISRRHYERFVMPGEKRIVEAVKEVRDIPVYVHTCGMIGDRLDLMTAGGAEGIDTLDPPPLGTVELSEAKQLLSGRAFIKGNMDPVNTLLPGPRAAVLEDARRRLEIGMPDGGYILSSACSVAPATPSGHLEALAEAVEFYGWY